MTHYEKNEMLLNSPINVVFDDMLRMTNEEFDEVYEMGCRYA